MVLASLSAVNGVKLALLVALVITPVASGALAGWAQQPGALARFGGLAVGLLIGSFAAGVVVLMTNHPSCYCGDGLRLSIGNDSNLTGHITPMWAALYPVKLAAAAITTWTVTGLVLEVARAGLGRDTVKQG